jgi:multimeric flavodoxin WrbA
VSIGKGVIHRTISNSHCPPRKGRCTQKDNFDQKDNFESIKQKIRVADGLILASPNYIYSVSAQLKAFMDRCGGILRCVITAFSWHIALR